MRDGRISISYAGVHTAYQMARAAHEMGALKAFYCAALDEPGWISRLIGRGLAEGRDAADLPRDRVSTYPWPLVSKALRDRVYPRGVNHWLGINVWFDRWAAAQLRADPPELFVGVSTSDLHTLTAAKRAGAKLLHDVPHLHPVIEAELLVEARERAGLPAAARRRIWRRDMTDRKLEEMALADRLVTYSEFHRQTYVRAGIAVDRIAVTPLWAEPELWYRDAPFAPRAGAPLRVLYVGAISLRKGIPFLLRAAALCGRAIQLTLVGARDAESAILLRDQPCNVCVLPSQPKPQLRAIYQAHDLFVLPSVGDAFGYVALEAMACGLPVILSAHCGAPTPAPDWIVPAMDAEALAARMLHYAADRPQLMEDSVVAGEHATRFTAPNYRAAVRREFTAVLK